MLSLEALPQHRPSGPPAAQVEDETTRLLNEARAHLQKSHYTTLAPLLPALLNLKGEPYTLRDHFPFGVFFRTRMPQRLLVKSGRQVAKSSTMASQGVILSTCIPFFATLFVTPLYEQIRRFSTNYVRPFIELSPIRNMLVGSGGSQSVLQKSFRNNSEMFFSFAFLDVERIRGISVHKLAIDEVQDVDPDHLPIMDECLSASKWKLRQFTGTPKSLDNTANRLWKDSSQAEWVIKCHHGGCGHYNVPALGHDLLQMIGPWRSDISEAEPGLVCAKCRKPVRPRSGRWVHGKPDRKWKFAGYHIPQVIMPMHYGDKEAWALLLAKQRGAGNIPLHVFMNECLGEAFDLGSKLVTETDLVAACLLPHRNKLIEAADPQLLDQYLYRVLSVDWGGGGEEEVSFTSISVQGIRPDGRIDVLFGHRSLRMHEHQHEAALCLKLMHRFRCSHIAHDYTGAGSLRETFLIQAGLPVEQIVPIAYMRAAMGPIMQFKQMSMNTGQRAYYQVDKSRSLSLTCQQIKAQQIRFFQDDFVNSDEPGLIRDFLALQEEKTDSRLGRDVYTIVRDPHLPDDFAQAVNMGACTLWYLTGQWPNLAAAARLTLTADILEAIAPRRWRS